MNTKPKLIYVIALWNLFQQFAAIAQLLGLSLHWLGLNPKLPLSVFGLILILVIILSIALVQLRQSARYVSITLMCIATLVRMLFAFKWLMSQESYPWQAHVYCFTVILIDLAVIYFLSRKKFGILCKQFRLQERTIKPERDVKLFFKRTLVGYSLSTVVAICVHLRGNAIQSMPEISFSEDRSGVGMSRDDFVQDIRRIQNEVYDPIRPVSEKGTFLLKLEMAFYASGGILASSIFSPTFLPAFGYSEQIRQDHRRRLPLGGTLPESIGATAQAEGMAWGVGQGVAFYLPFFAGRRRKAEGETSGSKADRERSTLDSAIEKCDE